LPETARHYVMARRFVGTQTSASTLTIATPDLPLWKFGGMFFASSRELNPADAAPHAWLGSRTTIGKSTSSPTKPGELATSSAS
jgi:hypothetical protein